MNNKIQIRYGLLNYEGVVIWAQKIALDSYEIYHQYEKRMTIISA